MNPDGLLFSKPAPTVTVQTPSMGWGLPHITALCRGLPSLGTEHDTEPHVDRASGRLTVTAFWHLAAGLDASANRK